MRVIGIKVYQSSLYSNFFRVSQKLFIENFFELCLANFLNLDAVTSNNHEFGEFFNGFGNQTNQVLAVGYTVTLSLFGIYYLVKIY